MKILKALDFRTGNTISQEPFIVQPNENIRSYDVEIGINRSSDITVKVGCKSFTIDQATLDIMVDELNDITKPEDKITLILPIDDNRKLTSFDKIPKFLESSETMLISKSGKTYSKTTHKTVEKMMVPPNQFFRPSTMGRYYSHTFLSSGSGVDLNKHDVDVIRHILEIISNFYAERELTQIQ